jgi:hypothetical protein
MEDSTFVYTIADQLGVGREALSVAEARTKVRRHLRAFIGALARTLSMTAEERSESASKAARCRWSRVTREDRPAVVFGLVLGLSVFWRCQPLIPADTDPHSG